MKRMIRAALVAAAIALPMAAQAATTIQINSESFASSSDTGIIHDAASPFNGASVGIGEFELTGTNLTTSSSATFFTYCIDIFHALSIPSTYTITPLSQLVTDPGKRGQLLTLLTNTTASSADTSAAIQLAVWEIAFETGPTYDVNAGIFSVTGGDSSFARSTANSYLSMLGTWQPASGKAVNLLYAPNNQSQIFITAVPEPASWAMMIAGFGMAGVALRRRRALAAVA